ncbi:MliC family protein [Budviciaceae bacterium CWB-B4]|uniref:MliC family protein n=1 Tax=Limnobaculum xujianqingii TaxID=2738837 RepID=A0A9D7AKS8_9GAMM|nr:MliC family protein [Limnobaculum xujianqingii]MBK5074541.1 MliC family protein [Limnobaculum xujianqingii]MBK5177793.1 MliC family protein [Limnobaculum xujianqingii]
MKKLFIVMILGMASTSVIAASTQKTTNYSCDDGGYSFELTRINSNKVKIVDGAGNTATLKAQESASGEKYVSNQYTLSLKGDMGMLVYKDKSNKKSYPHNDCKLQ